MSVNGYYLFGICSGANNECDGGELVYAPIGIPDIGEDWTEGLPALESLGLSLRFIVAGPERHWLISAACSETESESGCCPIAAHQKEIPFEVRATLQRMSQELGWSPPTWLLVLDESPKLADWARQERIAAAQLKEAREHG